MLTGIYYTHTATQIISTQLYNRVILGYHFLNILGVKILHFMQLIEITMCECLWFFFNCKINFHTFTVNSQWVASTYIKLCFIIVTLRIYDNSLQLLQVSCGHTDTIKAIIHIPERDQVLIHACMITYHFAFVNHMLKNYATMYSL